MRHFLKSLAVIAALTFLAIGQPVRAQQAYNGIAQRPSDSPLIYGVFDLPDGTTVTGHTLESGNSSWSNLGSGNFVATGGEATNGNAGCTPQPACSNTYNDFPNTATLGGTAVPITYQWGTFRLNQAAVMPIGFIADMAGGGVGGTAFVNFLHLNIGQNGWALTYCVTGSCPAGFNYLGASGFAKPLVLGAVYGVAWDIDEVAHKVRVHLPDGSFTSWYSFPSGLVPVVNRFQIGGFSAPLSANWISVGSGQSKAEGIVAAGFGAPMAEVARLNALHNEIGDQKSGLTFGTPHLFATFLTPGAQLGDRLVVSTETIVESAALPGVALDIEDWELPIFSTACCNTLGSILSTHSNPQNSAAVCLSTALTASISGTPGSPYTIALYITPTVGCPNAGYITGARFNYNVEAKGDPNGVLTKQ